jgi:hypothetical protein
MIGLAVTHTRRKPQGRLGGEMTGQTFPRTFEMSEIGRQFNYGI